ncbi:hypothetical protein [Streptomyces ipomoeae]|uniref:hypothetical protein n=1 Tax=Streptomyces ipomoeae TaxID=103232 RepID=UPI001146F035|nr:hypothetical protein [Streptomyces ipomoeae]MDX2936388.1 hypothetical protein [Streptomyces ipomoeae]TQE24484.1 hypothetical protein SipoB123_18180 [Streptomyces ipomoeae]
MRVHTTTVLSFSALAVLVLAGCSHDSATSSGPRSSTTVPVHPDGQSAPAPTPLSSTALAKRLLDESDLGEGYIRMPQRTAAHDDVSVIGCPTLGELAGDAAAGGSLDFPRNAKASFTYAGGPGSKVAEELYSDTEDKLSREVGRIFEAMTSCPTYQVLAGGTPVTVTTQKALVARRLGDEQWSQLLTFTAGGRSSIVKQTAVRTGTVVVVVSGSSGLVDAHVRKAVAKVTAVRLTE